MTNQEAKTKLEHILVDLRALYSSDANAEDKENLYKAVVLLDEVNFWDYEVLNE